MNQAWQRAIEQLPSPPAPDAFTHDAGTDRLRIIPGPSLVGIYYIKSTEMFESASSLNPIPHSQP